MLAKDQAQTPSPRQYHCAWEYGEKMWVFGGYGLPPTGYLNDHGNFVPYLQPSGLPGVNNQLLWYDPSTGTWTNVKYSGEVPSPRCKAFTTVITEKMWLYGGSNDRVVTNDSLYELNMQSFVWTQIETNMPRPQVKFTGGFHAPLTQISADQFVLYGGTRGGNLNISNIPWIFDVQSHTWSRHPKTEGHPQWSHKHIVLVTCLKNNVIILAKKTKSAWIQDEATDFSVMLDCIEPKSLQHLAIQMIYKHRSKLPWESLPRKLSCKISGK